MTTDGLSDEQFKAWHQREYGDIDPNRAKIIYSGADVFRVAANAYAAGRAAGVGGSAANPSDAELDALIARQPQLARELPSGFYDQVWCSAIYSWSCRAAAALAQMRERIAALVAENGNLAQQYAKIKAVNDLFRHSSVAEIATRNVDVRTYMAHWEGRAERAEADVARLTGLYDDSVADFNRAGQEINALRADVARLTRERDEGAAMLAEFRSGARRLDLKVRLDCAEARAERLAAALRNLRDAVRICSDYMEFADVLEPARAALAGEDGE